MLRRTLRLRQASSGTAATGSATATSAPAKGYKKAVKPDPALMGRYFNNFWTYRVSQLTTSNVAAMKAAGINAGSDQPAPVVSDIQIHGIHKFRGDASHSVCVVVDKNSAHARNLLDGGEDAVKKVSLMAGHTDPQIFHWFKQLGTIPPRSILSGTAEVLKGDLLDEAWEGTFVRHPVMHDRAHAQWEQNETKTDSEQAEISQRERDEDERRMLRLSNSDWRAKSTSREKNPTPKEDLEQPIYVMKPDAYVTFRMRPEVLVWGDYAGNLQRIWWDPKTEAWPEMDPLARAAPRFIRMANLSRSKLVASVNINYNLKLTNLFVYALDKKGVWAMATQENAEPLAPGAPPRESWNEFRLEYGQDQTVETESDLEWWFKGLMRLGVPEQAPYDQQVEGSADEHNFRHN